MVENTYIILQARMNSQRLPGKIMMPINGIPLIGILLKRIQTTGLPIIVATSYRKENDPLVKYLSEFNVRVFRGSEDNVLDRYYQAAKEVNAKTIIRLTGDNPLFDGIFLKSQLKKYNQYSGYNNYLSTTLSKTYPLGMSAEIFSMKLLETAHQKASLPGEFEHVTPYMHQNVSDNVNIIAPERKISKYHYRLTVDTNEDFIFNKILIEDYKCDKLEMEEIISIIDNNPELLLINKDSSQKQWNE